MSKFVLKFEGVFMKVSVLLYVICPDHSIEWDLTPVSSLLPGDGSIVSVKTKQYHTQMINNTLFQNCYLKDGKTIIPAEHLKIHSVFPNLYTFISTINFDLRYLLENLSANPVTISHLFVGFIYASCKRTDAGIISSVSFILPARLAVQFKLVHS